jgi:cytochrome c5
MERKKIMRLTLPNITSLLLVLCSPLAFAQPAKTQDPKPAPTPPASSPAAMTPEERGDLVWRANCSRCHNPPDQLNPRITGTIIRHMRVRANLTAAEERDILRFLNP